MEEQKLHEGNDTHSSPKPIDAVSSGEEVLEKDTSDKDLGASNSSGSNMVPLQKNSREAQTQTESKNEDVHKMDGLANVSIISKTDSREISQVEFHEGDKKDSLSPISILFPKEETKEEYAPIRRVRSLKTPNIRKARSLDSREHRFITSENNKAIKKEKLDENLRYSYLLIIQQTTK